MTTTNAIGSASGTNGGLQVQANVRNLDAVTGEDFMNLLIRQLQYQDPFKPMGNEEMIAQISTIRELEMNTGLARNLEKLTTEQRFGAAAALIGREVKGTVKNESGEGFEVSGIVTAVRFNSQGDALLELDTGEVLPMSGLELVKSSPGDVTLAVTDQGTVTQANAGKVAPTQQKGISTPVIVPVQAAAKA